MNLFARAELRQPDTLGCAIMAQLSGQAVCASSYVTAKPSCKRSDSNQIEHLMKTRIQEWLFAASERCAWNWLAWKLDRLAKLGA